MKNPSAWRPTKYEWHRGRWRGSRDASEVGVGSRLMTDLVAARYQAHVADNVRGRLLDLGCGKVPLYGIYEKHVTSVTCVDWAAGEHIDVECDLSQPLPMADASFDTIVLSDVLEHMSDPELVWREMTRLTAPGGKIIVNVPFYYSIHAHPHDYYRYTNFALERFVKINGLRLLHIETLGGIVEIVADIFAKALSKIPGIGTPLSALWQWGAGIYGSTRLGQRVASASSRHFPLGYFLIAGK